MTIQTQRAGGHFKARFEGQADFCFGDTPKQASSKLLTWKKDQRPMKLLLLAKYQSEAET